MTGRPKIIAVAGNMGAGKSSLVKWLCQQFELTPFFEPHDENPYLADFYGDMKRWSFTLQLEFLMRRAEHHELIRTVPKSCVQDRSLYEDPEIFAKYLHGLGNMDDRELDLYFEYFHRLNRDLPRPDLIFMLEVPDVKILLDRIRKRGRKEEGGIDVAFLSGLNAYYSTFPQVCRRKHGIPIYQISVAETDIRTPEGRRDFLQQVEAAFKECAIL